ncbi:hypothetical protein ACFQZX_15665 [Mucilaginibacter litoreus]|uniref:Uncharacterized protein n=1 Tax=Mucilaginibacter litoreus TaxID=1048221 RepID=A0ABW3AXE9_9SPHI
MKRFLLTGVCLIVLFASCSRKLNNGCPVNQICTEIFASVGTQFVDNNGNAVTVTDFKVTNQRTNRTIQPKGELPSGNLPPFYTIVNDSNKKELSTKGDDIIVTAVYNGQKVTGTFKISGGCNCHVTKLSGPEKIIVN